MTRYNVGDKIKIRDNITYYDTKLNKVDHSNLYDRILTVCNVFKVDNNILIQVEEDKIHLLKPEWIEHIEDKEKNIIDRPSWVTIAFNYDGAIGKIHKDFYACNTVELNYLNDIDYNESTASISHKVINKLFKGIEE